MHPLSYFRDSVLRGEKLSLLPVSRVLVEQPTELGSGVVIYPPNWIDPNDLRVVSWPERDFHELLRKNGKRLEDGNVSIQAQGADLTWFKSAATRIDLPEFFGYALVGLTAEIDWEAFLAPASHEAHLQLIARAAEQAESVFDVVRFYYCNPTEIDTLPGKVGFANRAGFSCCLFYDLSDHESYLIAGKFLTHDIVAGQGLDMTGIGRLPVLARGEVGNVARHALNMLSQAIEANTDTSKFVQMLAVIEYIADPDRFIKMHKVKGAIGRHVARSRTEYNEIIEDFRYLTSEGETVQPNRGLRHNIVHLGRRLDDLLSPDERKKVFKRLSRYVGVPLEHLINHSADDWSVIEKLRHEAGVRLGLQ
jgi:hypothetical protein